MGDGFRMLAAVFVSSILSLIVLVQSALHLGFCVWGTNFYLCRYPLHNGTFRYLFYLTYFYSSTCTNVSTSDLPFERSLTRYNLTPIVVKEENNSPPIVVREENNSTPIVEEENNSSIPVDDLPNLHFPSESWVAERTFNIMQGFIIVDSLWIIAAVALFIGVHYQVKQFLSMIFYFPWICILMIILFFDSIAAVWFGMDVTSTYGLKNWFQFIGGEKQEGLDELSKKYIGPFTSLPSIIMTTIFSRLFMIWFINLFLVFRITQAAINAYDDYNDELSRISSKDNNVDVVTSISVDNNICSRNFQVRHINPILLDVRRRRSQIQYGSDDDDDIRTVRKYKKKVKIHNQTIDEIPSCSNFETSKEIKKLSKLNTEGQVCDDNFLKVVVGYEGDRSNSPSPIYNRKQTFNFSSTYTSSYVVQISKAFPTQ